MTVKSRWTRARAVKCALLVAATACALATGPGARAGEPPLVFARFHYPPILFHPQQGDTAVLGYAAELVREAFMRSGREVRFVAKPLRRAMAELAGNGVDGVAALNPRDMPGVLFAEVPNAALLVGCFTREDSHWRYEGLASLRQMVLGSVGGYDYWQADPAFQDYVAAGRGVREVTGPGAQSSLIGMLLAGRIDVFCNDVAHVRHTLRQDFPGRRLRRAGNLAGTIYGYFAVNAHRADARALLEAHDRGMRTLYADGTVREVLDRYGFFDITEGEALYAKMLGGAAGG